MDSLDEAVREKAVDVHVHDIYSRCLDWLGKGEQASVKRQKMIREGHATAPIYNDEALYLHNTGDSAGGLQVLAQAEQAGCANEHILALKAKLLQALGHGEEASSLRLQR